MKVVSCVLRVSAALLLTSTGLGGSAAVASPNSPENPADVTEIDRYVQAQGPAFIANQQKLSDFKGWVVTIPDLENAGYVDQVNDASKLSTKFLWKGPSHLRETVLAEAKARGISATFTERPHTLPEIREAVKKIEAKKGALRALGFQVDGIAGVRDDDGTIAIEGHAINGVSSDLAGVSRVAREAAGGAVHVVDKQKVTPAVATRSNDYAPFNSGGYMRRSGGGTCSTGFSLADANRTYTITARHCAQGDYYARDNWGTYVGYQVRDIDGQATLMSNTGSKWMFDGTWNNSAGYSKRVSGFQTASPGDYVCTSGGNSGVHCTVKIIGTSYWWDDDWGGAWNIEGYQQTAGAIAAIQGDSGGPVLMPRADGTVGAVGMIQAVINADPYGCGSVHDPGKCSPHVIFTSTIATAQNSGMYLVTG